MTLPNRPSRLTRGTIILIAVVQIILGGVFIFAPDTFASLEGLPTAPAWTAWIFGMFGARSLAFGAGMLWALTDLRRNASWLVTMIGVQMVDWLATLWALQAGKVTLMQVSTAPFLPVLFILVLALELRRQTRTADQPA